MQGEPEMTMIDLFSGCGGVTTGFKRAGFRVLAAVEIDPIAAQTYRQNHPEVRMYEADIRRIDPETIMRDCSVPCGHVTVLGICAPCQPFSRLTRKTPVDDQAWLLLETIRFIAALQPRVLFIENVPGLVRHPSVFPTFLDAVTELGYTRYVSSVIDAVQYGVPQFRKRFVVVATTNMAMDVCLPAPTHAPPDDAERYGLQVWRTVRDAFAGLPVIGAGESSATDPLHRSRHHSPLVIERLRHIPHNGGSRASLPESLQLRCHAVPHVGYRDVYGRMQYDMPAPTLTTGCTNVTKGRFAHPTADRAITLREAARLQTFPDTYRFCGSYEHIAAQIGNAVPVALAHAIAHSIRTMLSSSCHPAC